MEMEDIDTQMEMFMTANGIMIKRMALALFITTAKAKLTKEILTKAIKREKEPIHGTMGTNLSAFLKMELKMVMALFRRQTVQLSKVNGETIRWLEL